MGCRNSKNVKQPRIFASSNISHLSNKFSFVYPRNNNNNNNNKYLEDLSYKGKDEIM